MAIDNSTLNEVVHQIIDRATRGRGKDFHVEFSYDQFNCRIHVSIHRNALRGMAVSGRRAVFYLDTYLDQRDDKVEYLLNRLTHLLAKAIRIADAAMHQ
jgi:hypothetical protein